MVLKINYYKCDLLVSITPRDSFFATNDSFKKMCNLQNYKNQVPNEQPPPFLEA